MIVVDASVWVARLTARDCHHDASRDWFRACEAQGERLAAPALLAVEVAGALRRRTGSRALSDRALNDIVGLSTLELVPADRGFCTTAGRLAIALGLRGADAMYFAVAQMLDAPLVTWDLEMLGSGGAVEVISPVQHLSRLAP